MKIVYYLQFISGFFDFGHANNFSLHLRSVEGIEIIDILMNIIDNSSDYSNGTYQNHVANVKIFKTPQSVNENCSNYERNLY